MPTKLARARCDRTTNFFLFARIRFPRKAINTTSLAAQSIRIDPSSVLRSSSMARIFSQALIRSSSSSCFLSSSFPSIPAHSSRLLNLRNRSNRPEKTQLIELELDSDASESEVLGLRRLEDAIHGIIIRRSAPDWLPFVPGSSYWVPPRQRPLGVVELVGRLANPLSEEETMSLTTVRGWPSAAYYIEADHAKMDKYEAVREGEKIQGNEVPLPSQWRKSRRRNPHNLRMKDEFIRENSTAVHPKLMAYLYGAVMLLKIALRWKAPCTVSLFILPDGVLWRDELDSYTATYGSSSLWPIHRGNECNLQPLNNNALVQDKIEKHSQWRLGADYLVTCEMWVTIDGCGGHTSRSIDGTRDSSKVGLWILDIVTALCIGDAQ
ncbi:hypothetical protein ACLOJK_030812 [Asimina triloba]